ncbi:hypothetical protein AVEN_236493-1 [Araneus ventricosus]|uniref:Uncharacterized protein n=1 Tax=Araneus ventricosus TaxID=182803 RepID=A0A4Y2NX00_ARAVE|nr:hypothetical protein AVEN_236493-1 [Araneus ventricosus]
MSLPTIEPVDNPNETKNTDNAECDTLEKIQEDALELQSLYLENQQSAFDDFIRPNFPITVLICDEQQALGNSEESNKIRKDEIYSDEGETLGNIQDVYTMKEDTVHNSSHSNSDLEISTEIPSPSTKSSDNSLETRNVIGDQVETLEILQEDTSSLQALHLENQKGAFDESAKPKRRSKTKACRKWLLNWLRTGGGEINEVIIVHIHRDHSPIPSNGLRTGGGEINKMQIMHILLEHSPIYSSGLRSGGGEINDVFFVHILREHSPISSSELRTGEDEINEVFIVYILCKH